MGWFDKGKSDASQGKGAQNMQNASSQEREKYDAGYKQQTQDKNKRK